MEVVPPLLKVLEGVPDHREASGRRYPLASVLALVCAATLCGYRSYAAMAQWGEDYGCDWAKALGFKDGKTPSVGALHRILSRMDVEAFEAVLSLWAHSVLASARESHPKEAVREVNAADCIAIDGKTLRSSAKQGAPGAHLLSALVPALGLTLYQKSVPDKTNEIGAIQEVLQALVLEGRVVTVDALLTQREVAVTILKKGGTTS